MAVAYDNDVMDASNEDGAENVSIDDILDEQANIANLLSQKKLDIIGKQVVQDYETDLKTMESWLKCMADAIDLASQEIKQKSEPWPNASNVKHALILEACIQFAARAYPELMRDDDVVHVKTIGPDPDNSKRDRADRVQRHMNFQISDEMVCWDEDFDRLLHIVAMMGTVFKKVYYCPVEQRNVSELCLPDKVIVNQNVQNLHTARRITHEIELFGSQITERRRMGVFLDIDLDCMSDDEHPFNDQPYEFLEQVRYLDLDGDGYPEPYVVTVHKISETVVRIVRCFDEHSIVYDEELEIAKINRDEYFVDYHFIHAIDGTFYSYGFGYLLSHASHTINTLLNQLIDAGTMSNLQCGFYGKGARIKGGTLSFRPGEWKKADSSGVNLKDSIVPLPVREPSSVLLQLVEFLLNSYYKMVSISDIMSGQISGSNTTAAEATNAVEQGMKVYNSIYKRLYRGLTKEFKRLFALNKDFLPDEVYFNVLDQTAHISKDDYADADLALTPVSDKTFSTGYEDMMRVRAAVDASNVIPSIQTQPLGRMLLRSLKFAPEDIAEIVPDQDPNEPTPEQKAIAQELDQARKDLAVEEQELMIKKLQLQLDAVKSQFENAKIAAEVEHILAKAENEDTKSALEPFLARIKEVQAEASYIQAITPDSGGDEDDVSRGLSKLEGTSDDKVAGSKSSGGNNGE